MPKQRHVRPSDVRAIAQLATDAAIGLTDLVEAAHAKFSPVSRVLPHASEERTRGLPALVYKTVRGVAKVAGTAAEAFIGKIAPFFDEAHSTPEREAVIAAINGVLGDHMVASGNPLAIRMQFRKGGVALPLARSALEAAYPHGRRKILVLVHGLCMNDLQWRRHGHDHGAALAQEFGYSPVYLHYNTGLHVSVNGRRFADMLESLVQQWPYPVEELAIVCHSMGGLVSRSAYHYAEKEGHAWPKLLRKLVFLGTPHHGAPLERIGNWIDVILKAVPYAAPFARIGMVRSAGITDLRHGSLLDEDWEGRDRFARGPDPRCIVPLPASTACYALAATLGDSPDSTGRGFLGDGLVTVDSALGRHRDPDRCLVFAPECQRVATGAGHMDLLSSTEVHEQLRTWFSQ
ncbi:MAG TPA: alpha/beta hydrolase [Noviherbaspirillum sp.]